MNTTRIIFLAIAGTALVGGLSFGSSDRAEAVMVCRDRTSGEGVGRGVSEQRTTNARAAALADWARSVAARFGRQFANPSTAQSTRFDCRPGVLQAKCAVSALPCADVPRATKAKAKKSKAKKKKRPRR